MDYSKIFLGAGDALIIVPPFSSLSRPSLGAHVLQACARCEGFEVKILYSNILFAAEIGEKHYEALCNDITGELIGERLFASSAFKFPPMGRDTDALCDQKPNWISRCKCLGIESSVMKSLEAKASKWADLVGEIIVRHDFKVIGCTSTFQQILSSISLLNRIKRSRPEVVTILGGANCSGDMAKGILSLGFAVDFIFSGESEKTFPNFLKQIRDGLRISGSIIEEDLVLDLDEIPTPNYAEFYSQIESWLPGGSTFINKNAWLPYECSRGCFWGRCTFCGACGKSKRFRQKSPEHVVKELKILLKCSRNENISMVDNIMPPDFLKVLTPIISEELPGLNIFCEQKSNLSLDEIIALKKAGVNVIQTGIESLSNDCLNLMDKGVNASQNIALLRYSRSLDVIVKWNFLYGFPGDKLKEYQLMVDMLPMLLHLNPPVGLSCLNIQRFSIYFDHPDDYGISNIRPFKAYSSIFPEDIDLKNIAYHFVGSYRSDSIENPEIMQKIESKINMWINAWKSHALRPALAVGELSDDLFFLLDTRGLPNTQKTYLIDYNQASLILSGRCTNLKREIKWAIEKKLVIELDDSLVPLATASPEIFKKFLI